MSTLRKFHIPLPGAVLALIAFFLPWLSVGCQGLLTIEASGYDLASGRFFSSLNELTVGLSLPELNTNLFTILWLVPIVALVAIILVFLTARQPEIENRTSLGHILLGVVGLAALVVLWLQTRGNVGGDVALASGEVVQVKYGIWLTVVGLLVMLFGGILSYLESRRGMVMDYLPIENNTTTQSSAPGGYVGGSGTNSPPGPASDLSSFSRPITSVDDFTPPRRTTEVLQQREPAGLAWLVIKEGARAGHSFRLMETTSIGRDADNDIVIDDTALSGQHAKVKREDGGRFFIYDLASTNGIFFFDSEKNDWERFYRYELIDGRQIKLGRTVLHFMSMDEQRDVGEETMLDAKP